MWQVAVKMQALKICVVCMYKWISSSDLGPIPKISHYESEEIPKSKQILSTQHFQSQAFERRDTQSVTNNVRGNLCIVDVEYELEAKLPAHVAVHHGCMLLHNVLSYGMALGWLTTWPLPRVKGPGDAWEHGGQCSSCWHRAWQQGFSSLALHWNQLERSIKF